MISSTAIPADLCILTNVEIRNIRFDVKQGSTIQHVNAFDVEAVSFHAKQMNY